MDPALLGVLLEAQQALVLGQQVVPAPDPADPAGADLDPLQGQLLRHPQAALGGGVQTVRQDGLFHLGADPVRMRTSGPREPIQEALGPVGLVVAPDLVELLPGVPHEPTGLADVAQLLGQL